MTRNRKKKAIIRKRMKKTGETFTAAAKHVVTSRNGDNDGFIAIVEEVIRLATLHREEDDRLHPAGPTWALRPAAELLAMDFTPTATEIALLDYLQGLSPETLRKVEAVMYVGRDRYDSFHEVLTMLEPRSQNHLRNAKHIAGKRPLDEYLTQGLAAARRVGIDRMWSSRLKIPSGSSTTRSTT